MSVTRNRSSRWWLGMLLVWSVMCVHDGLAMPIDRFDVPVDVECADGASCAGFVRSDSTLGRYTGIALSRRGEGEVSARVSRKGNSKLTFEASDTQSATMTLSWDADQHPELLSGSGLNCLDLTRQGAYAFILSAVSIDADCVSDEQLGSSCPSFTIETRIYDAHDPTGQRFSGSVVTRTLTDESDIVIPFSNFVREGPRGKALFSCVGAVTLSFRFDGFESVEVNLGPVYTNGSEGLTPIPTATPFLTATPTATSTSLPTVTSTVVATPSATVDLTPLPVRTADAIPSTARGTSAPVEEAREQTEPSATAASPVFASPTARAVVPRIPRSQDEEIVYGAVVAGE